MRVERLNTNKIKVFLTYDDLNERGISKEEMWQDIPKVHELFRDMMSFADDEIGFKADGPIAVEVFSLPAQGMVVIVTKGHNEQDIDDEYEDDYIEMKVTLDESDEIFYEFCSFEDVISFSSRLYPLDEVNGKLYSYNGYFYMEFDQEEINLPLDSFIALLAEFGYPSTITKYRVAEYGKMLMEKNAIKDIFHYFVK